MKNNIYANDLKTLLKTKYCRAGADLYNIFCQYAGITFYKDNGCDSYTGITGITEYNNSIVKGKIRWSNTIYGKMACVGCQESLHIAVMQNTLQIPDIYFNNGYLTQNGFESWLNDKLISI
jgi:hypothetical protein